MIIRHRSMNHRCGVAAGVALASLLLAGPGAAQPPGPARPPSTEPNRTVLLIAPDDPGALFVRDTIDGFVEVLSQTPTAPVLYLEFVDVVRFNRPEQMADIKAWLRRKYQDRRIDLVVALTQSAVEMLVDEQGGALGAPAVYLSMGDLTIDVRRTLPTATGLIVDNPFPFALDVIRMLLPDTRRVGLVYGASEVERERGIWFLAQVEAAGFEALDLGGVPLAEIPARVAELSGETVLFDVGTRTDASGRIVAPNEACRELSALSGRPLFTLSRFSLGCGTVGGPLLDHRLSGRAVARHVLQRLSGEPAATERLPASTFAPAVFDARQLERWRIPESRLPAGSEVLYRPPSVWRDHRTEVIAALSIGAVQALLIAGFVVERRRRRRARAELQVRYDEVRDLTSRLISAQEQERTRIARELHDDLSQSIALLAIDIDLVRRQVEGDGPAAARLDDAWRRAGDIASSVHSLSHHLHPTKLDTLGLVPALRSLCVEISAAHDLRIDLRHDGVPREIPTDTSLCLFRVAQEALHNVVKHSEADLATVTLTGSNHFLDLEISDTGRGFGGAGMGQGLGLVSMRERVHLAGGRFELESGAGRGTRVMVTVPLPGRADADGTQPPSDRVRPVPAATPAGAGVA